MIISRDSSRHFKIITFLAGVGLTVFVGSLSATWPMIAIFLGALSMIGLIALMLPAIWQPRSFVYILALTLPFQIYLDLGLFPLSTTYVLIGASAGLWILKGITSSQWTLYLPGQVWPMSLFILFIFLNSVGATDVYASAILGVQIVAYFTLFLVTANVLDTELKIRQAVNLTLTGTAMISVLGIAQAVVGFFAPQSIVKIFFSGSLARFTLGARNLQRLGNFGPGGPIILYRGINIQGIGNIFRAFGTFEGPTVYGLFTATLAVFATAFWLIRINATPGLNSKARWVAWLAMTALFLSWTRSGWLALVIGLVFVLAFRRATSIAPLSKRWWKFALLALLTVGLLILIGYFFPDSAVGRMILSSIGGAEASGSNALRAQTTKFALDHVMRNPVRGVGLGNYASVRLGEKFDASIATFATAHNTFLELGVELGIPGLLAFIWLLVGVFMGARNLVRQPLGSYWHTLGVALAGVWVAFVVNFMFSGNIVQPKWMPFWWLLAGLQAASGRILRQKTQSGAA